MSKRVVCFDYETYLMDKDAICPKPVCLSYKTEGAQGVLATCDTGYQTMHDRIFADDPNLIAVAHNCGFDTPVSMTHGSDANVTNIFNAIEKSQFTDTMVREKLLNLATDGIIEKGYLADGTKVSRERGYSLAALVKKYFAIDLTDEKNSDDAWRLRYSELDGVPAAEYPQEAYDYALMDSVYAWDLYWLQEERRKILIEERGFDPLKLEFFYTKKYIAFVFGLTCNGIYLNHEEKAEVDAMLDRELSRDKMEILYQQGVISEVIPPMPFANGARDHVEGCDKKKTKAEFTCRCPRKVTTTGRITVKHEAGCEKPKSKPEFMCDCPVKMTQEQGESVSTESICKHTCIAILKGQVSPVWKPKAQEDDEFMQEARYYWDLLQSKEAEDNWTAIVGFYTSNVMKLAVNKQFFADNDIMVTQDEKGNNICDFPNEVLRTFRLRAMVTKMKTTEMPRLCNPDGTTAERVFPQFDLLKETGRTSSFASKLYPSINAQNIHAKVRNCLSARPNMSALTVDYSGLEFITGAQTCLDIIGNSNYARIINLGWDSHSYLAAQKVYVYNVADILSCGMTFSQLIDKLKLADDKDAMYLEFKKLEFTDFKFYKKNRTAAKPDGLGFFGGLGPATMVTFTKAQTGLEISEEQARIARDVWRDTFPYAYEYLQHVNKNCVDPFNSASNDYRGKRYMYSTPMGLHRMGCTYNACANGGALQSPAAEGATEAQYKIIREAMDPASKSILRGNYVPTAFVHDETIGDVPLDPEIMTQVSDRVVKIMCDELRKITPDVAVNADPAYMKVWSKDALDVYTPDGLLMVWLPNIKYRFENGKRIDDNWREHLDLLKRGIAPRYIL